MGEARAVRRHKAPIRSAPPPAARQQCAAGYARIAHSTHAVSLTVGCPHHEPHRPFAHVSMCMHMHMTCTYMSVLVLSQHVCVSVVHMHNMCMHMCLCMLSVLVLSQQRPGRN